MLGRFLNDVARLHVQIRGDDSRTLHRQKMLERCRDIVRDDRGFILALEDVDIKALLEFRARKDYKMVHNYLDELIRKLVM